MVKLLHENRSEGCTANAMDWAAQSGDLKMIIWLHKNRSEGCDRALVLATEYCDLMVFKYLVKNALGLVRIQEAMDLQIAEFYVIGKTKRKLFYEIKRYLGEYSASKR